MNFLHRTRRPYTPVPQLSLQLRIIHKRYKWYLSTSWKTLSRTFIIFTSLLWTVSLWSSSYLAVSRNGLSNSARFCHSWPEYKDYFCVTDCLPVYKFHHEAYLTHNSMIYVQFVIYINPKTNSEKLIQLSCPVFDHLIYLFSWSILFVIHFFLAIFSFQIFSNTNPVFQHLWSPSSLISLENIINIYFP